MKNILSSLNEYEKKRILEMHYRASQRQYLAENPTGTTPTTTAQTTTPGDPSQATVDISSIMSELKSACNTFNTEIANKTKLNLGNNGLTTLVTPEGQTTGGPYITITSPYFQNISGTKRPYGMIGVELSKGYYGVHNWGVAAINEASLQRLLISIKNLIGQTVIAGDRGSDKGSKFNAKYNDQISAATTTLFNTVDPIFRKLLGYKGYNSATISPTGEVTISKTA